MRRFIKQFLCRHQNTTTKTEARIENDNSFFIVSSLIKCADCDKTFPQHPNAQCCYIQHIHAEAMRDHWLNKFKNTKQNEVK